MVLGADLHLKMCDGQPGVAVDASVRLSNGPVCFFQDGLRATVQSSGHATAVASADMVR